MPSNRTPKKNAAVSPAASLQLMLDELRARCPSICPSVVPPAVLSDGEHGVALLGLCRSSAERSALAALLARARQGIDSCEVTARAVNRESELRFISQWELRPDDRVCQLRRCAFACADAALLLDTAAVLERFTHAGADCAELSRLAQLFCEANHRPGQPERSAVEARLWLQECLTLACACQVIAANMAPWRLVGPDGGELWSNRSFCFSLFMIEPQAKATAFQQTQHSNCVVLLTQTVHPY